MGCILAFAVGIILSLLFKQQTFSNNYLIVNFLKEWKNTFKQAGEGRGRTLTLVLYFLMLVIVSWGFSLIGRLIKT